MLIVTVALEGFLSTLSLRRATQHPYCLNSSNKFLSTLSLRRATLRYWSRAKDTTDFYPRSPCGERQRQKWPNRQTQTHFYPRSPCGERPQVKSDQRHSPGISIHALLAESDRPTLYPLHRQQHFYPRSPCGERPSANFAGSDNSSISIHALLAESDTAED